MPDHTPVTRRDFLRTGAAAAAAAAAAPTVAAGQDPDAAATGKAKPFVLPRRKLGKTGVEVTILAQGAAFAINERHLNMMHDLGIRYIDTAKYYLKEASERAIADWFAKTGRRKDYFLVTKDVPKTPQEMVEAIDARLQVLKTDYLDLFFLHGFGDDDYFAPDPAKAVLADPEWAKAADKVRASGKCRFIGYSSHTRPIESRTAVIEATAKAGWIDAIMIAADPVSIRDNAAFNKALDACHQAGVGLVSMKECLGRGKTEDERLEELTARITPLFPTYKEKGLSIFTAVLSAMWTDQRFACVCSHMDNLEKLTENATACRDFKPLTGDELAAVDQLIRGSTRTFCVACDGSCRHAAGTTADLNTIARYVSYAEQEGRVFEARELLNKLPAEARDWSGADLAAATRACKCNLDFAGIVKRAQELLA
jgi:aryl-alcohol dehydrogenase-like predicted oxidoreductase